HHPLIFAHTLTDHDAVGNFRQGFHLPIDLRGADAHATGIQGGVGATVDNGAAVFIELDVVAMGPDTGKAFEISGVITFAVGIVPETNRHARCRLGTHHLTTLTNQRPTVVGICLDSHAQHGALDFAAAYRQDWTGTDETGHDIGPARYGAQQHIGLD